MPPPPPRLASSDAAMPAPVLGERHSQDRTRLPVGRRARRRGAFDAADRQPEILHPRGEHVTKHAPGFLDIKILGLWFILHETAVPRSTRLRVFSRILKGIRRKGDCCCAA